MAEYNLSVHAIVNIFLYNVPFAHQLNTIEENIMQFSDSSRIKIESK